MNLVLLSVIACLLFLISLGSLVFSVMMFNKLTSIDGRVTKIDADSERIKQASQKVQSQLEVILNESNNMDPFPMSDVLPPGQKRVFKSLDGKHEAETFEQLIEKMRQDPEYQQMMDVDDDDDEDKPWEQKDK